MWEQRWNVLKVVLAVAGVLYMTASFLVHRVPLMMTALTAAHEQEHGHEPRRQSREMFGSGCVGENNDTSARAADFTTTPAPGHPGEKRPLAGGAPEAGEVTKVVLVAYYRGGSTFLGELFNQNPGAFYWFEPLNWPVWRLSRDVLHIDADDFFFHPNATRRALSPDHIRELTATIRNILDCNLSALDRSILGHYFLTDWSKAVKGLAYANCYHQFVQPGRINTCLPWLTDACRASKVRAIKTIRLPAFVAEVLAAEDPGIRFVYYPRDPRGMLNSRSKFKGYLDWSDTEAVEGHVVRQCMWSRLDEAGYRGGLAEARHRPLVVSYEEFSLDPVPVARRVYDSAGLALPDIVARWLEEHTSSSHPNGLLGTTRNSSLAAFKWRAEVPGPVLDLFTQHCSDVLQAQGYPTRVSPPPARPAVKPTTGVHLARLLHTTTPARPIRKT